MPLKKTLHEGKSGKTPLFLVPAVSKVKFKTCKTGGTFRFTAIQKGGLKKFEQKTRKKGPKFAKNSKFIKIKFKIRKYEQLRTKKWLKSS